MRHQNKKFLTAVKIAGFTAAAAMLLIGTGCAQPDNSGMNEFFPEREAQAVRDFADAQAASGARADATLQSTHFDGGKLNSLGEAKLDLMLKDDDSTDNMVVYMNLNANDPQLKNRQDAVKAYLEDRGVAQDHIELKAGPNPNVTSLTAEHMANMKKTESGGENSSFSGSANPANAGYGTSSSSGMTAGSDH